jgi:hypothetical protein
MKKSFVFLTLLSLLSAAGCSTLPAPKTENDSLVVGSFVVDFPDSFFGGGPRKIINGVRLDFMNNNTGEKLILLTSNGFFRFITNGSDDYIFTSFSFEEEYDNHIITIGPVPLRIPLLGVAAKVLYAGHTVVTFSQPEVLGFTDDAGMTKKTFNYKQTLSTDWKEEAVSEFLKQFGAENTWGKLPILKIGKTGK